MSKVNKAVVYALLGMVCFVVLIKVVDLIKQPNTQSVLPVANEVLLESREVVAEGVSSDEKDRIVAFIDTFERAIAQKDSDKALSFFSMPETDKEQEELDFILGSDIARNIAKSSAQRLFTTQGYNYSLGAHYVRAVAAQGANRRVSVDELRTIASGGEFVGYSANVARLVIELRKTSHGYEIVRYYHEDSENKNVLKYDGFIAK